MAPTIAAGKGLPPVAASQMEDLKIEESLGTGNRVVEASASNSSASGDRASVGSPASCPPPRPAPLTEQHSTYFRHELHEIQRDLETHYQFLSLRPEAQPVFGLQDWSTEQWAENLRLHPDDASFLVTAMLGSDAWDDSTGITGLRGNVLVPDASRAATCARSIKDQLAKPLPQSVWRLVVVFQNICMNKHHQREEKGLFHYMDPSILSFTLFRREFPLGVDDRVDEMKWNFAIANSGLRTVNHRHSKFISIFVWGTVLGIAFFVLAYLLALMTDMSLWTMEATLQDLTNPKYTIDVNKRTKDRGTVASILQSFTFSAVVNSSLDKVGKIDPSTSTVLIGMLLGNTFGFILDAMLGSDEGLREYLWDPAMGMKYAMGSLATDRFGRYLVTILFDMFFTVILFKHFYSMLVQVAGFSESGRAWVANAFVSGFIGFITFQVYANMTRFQWAYPSGVEDVRNQWISGPTMLLATVIMNMVYLTSETRTRVGEAGINDPAVKLVVTVFTFGILYLLQANDILDPSDLSPRNVSAADWQDVSRPLQGVCQAQARLAQGIFIFSGIACGSLGAVIYGTSTQTLSGVQEELGCRKAGLEDKLSFLPGSASARRQEMNREQERKKGKMCLFFSYLAIILVLMLFFSFTPFHSHSGTRNDAEWREACDSYDKATLELFNLS